MIEWREKTGGAESVFYSRPFREGCSLSVLRFITCTNYAGLTEIDSCACAIVGAWRARPRAWLDNKHTTR
jgi:hypothetical protein